MGSTDDFDEARGRWQPSPAPAIASYPEPARIPEVTAVWVQLELLVRSEPEAFRMVPEGLDFTGRARGFVVPETVTRTAAGVWLYMTNYQVRYADGRPKPRLFFDQLVPAYALSPREDKQPLG